MIGVQTNEQMMEVRLDLKAKRGASSKRPVCRAILTIQATALMLPNIDVKV